MNGPEFVALGVTLIAAATDLARFKVYNVLTFPTLLIGLVLSTALGGLAGLGSSLLGAAVGFGLLVVFFAMGGVGAGDVKLLAALGAWLGPELILRVFAASGVAAGLYALALTVARGGVGLAVVEVASIGHRMLMPSGLKSGDTTMETEVRRADRRRRLVPFAAMICAGYLAVLACWRDGGPIPAERGVAVVKAHERGLR